MPITYQINGRPCAQDVRQLAVSVGWADPVRHGLDRVQSVWDAAPCTVLAYDGDRLVGMCRAMWDGHILAEIRYVVVHPDYQRRGIGGELVRLLIEELDNLGVAHLTLVASQQNLKFYEKFGFKVREGLTPMIRTRLTGQNPEEGEECCSR